LSFIILVIIAKVSYINFKSILTLSFNVKLAILIKVKYSFEDTIYTLEKFV